MSTINNLEPTVPERQNLTTAKINEIIDVVNGGSGGSEWITKTTTRASLTFNKTTKVLTIRYRTLSTVIDEGNLYSFSNPFNFTLANEDVVGCGVGSDTLSNVTILTALCGFGIIWIENEFQIRTTQTSNGFSSIYYMWVEAIGNYESIVSAL